jgi:hypothetical protein
MCSSIVTLLKVLPLQAEKDNCSGARVYSHVIPHVIPHAISLLIVMVLLRLEFARWLLVRLVQGLAVRVVAPA